LVSYLYYSINIINYQRVILIVETKLSEKIKCIVIYVSFNPSNKSYFLIRIFSGFDQVNSTDSNFNNDKGRKKLIVFDMDSTLIDAECIDKLAEAAGAGEEVSEITEQAMEGDIDYKESLVKRVQLLEGTGIETAQEVIRSLPIMPGAKELVYYVKSLGYKTAMISSGFTLATDYIGSLLDIDHVFSNELVIDNGYITGEVRGPLTEQDSKKYVFEQIAQMNGIHPENCIAVGDGANDICVFKKAGYSIAFNSKPILQQYADVVITRKDLRAIIPVIEALNME
jgi:phosphoserine phosphatase